MLGAKRLYQKREASASTNDAKGDALPGYLDCIAQAEKCRREATIFGGKPEAAFLLRIAGCFEDLAAGSVEGRRVSSHTATDQRKAAPRAAVGLRGFRAR
jgi:hypothetical protein